MAKWNYRSLKGEIFNKMSLEQQLDILKKHYPIGMVVRMFDFQYQNEYFTIMDYVLAGSQDWKYYNLVVKSSSFEDKMHPGFFEPIKSELRRVKLSNLGI